MDILKQDSAVNVSRTVSGCRVFESKAGEECDWVVSHVVVKRRLKHGRDRTVLLQEKWGKKERSEGKQPGLPLGRLHKGQVLAAKNQRAVFVT